MNQIGIAARRQRERLRQEFRPEAVRLLFIGDSPPASGRFYYRGDSGLYRAMREVFQVIDPSITDSTFFTVFQESGCYLFDLCPEPVDHLGATARRDADLGRLYPARHRDVSQAAVWTRSVIWICPRRGSRGRRHAALGISRLRLVRH